MKNFFFGFHPKICGNSRWRLCFFLHSLEFEALTFLYPPKFLCAPSPPGTLSWSRAWAKPGAFSWIGELNQCAHADLVLLFWSQQTSQPYCFGHKSKWLSTFGRFSEVKFAVLNQDMLVLVWKPGWSRYWKKMQCITVVSYLGLHWNGPDEEVVVLSRWFPTGVPL